MPLPQRDISMPSIGVIAISIAAIALASDLLLQRPLRPLRRVFRSAPRAAGVA